VMLAPGMQETHWRPSPAELILVLIVCGGGLLAATSATIVGWSARRQMQRTGMGFRGWGAAWAAAWFWPVVGQGVISLCFVSLILAPRRQEDGGLPKESPRIPAATVSPTGQPPQAALEPKQLLAGTGTESFGPVIELEASLDWQGEPIVLFLDLEKGELQPSLFPVIESPSVFFAGLGENAMKRQPDLTQWIDQSSAAIALAVPVKPHPT
jgi:hypothetical protein